MNDKRVQFLLKFTSYNGVIYGNERRVRYKNSQKSCKTLYINSRCCAPSFLFGFVFILLAKLIPFSRPANNGARLKYTNPPPILHPQIPGNTGVYKNIILERIAHVPMSRVIFPYKELLFHLPPTPLKNTSECLFRICQKKKILLIFFWA